MKLWLVFEGEYDRELEAIFEIRKEAEEFARARYQKYDAGQYNPWIDIEEWETGALKEDDWDDPVERVVAQVIDGVVTRVEKQDK